MSKKETISKTVIPSVEHRRRYYPLICKVRVVNAHDWKVVLIPPSLGKVIWNWLRASTSLCQSSSHQLSLTPLSVKRSRGLRNVVIPIVFIKACL